MYFGKPKQRTKTDKIALVYGISEVISSAAGDEGRDAGAGVMPLRRRMRRLRTLPPVTTPKGIVDGRRGRKGRR